MTFFRCKACTCDVKVTHGKGDLIKHAETAKHKKSCQSSTGQRDILAMFKGKDKGENIEAMVKQADLRISGFIAEHNLPFKLMEHLPDLLRSTCSDSAIAKKIRCGPTKVKSIITNVMGVSERQRIVELMKNNKFSLIADESTDRSCVKNLSLVVRINCENEYVKDYFLALIPVQEATGAALFDHIINFLNNYSIPYKDNCIGFASDGANNMMGAQNSVVSRLKEAIPNIFIMKCICHSFHLCASYACEMLPQEIEKFTKDVYNYFANSPKRSGELKQFQEFANVSPVKILHPAATRWLSLGAVVKRLLDQFNALILYFTEQSFQNNLQAISILHSLQQPETKLYLEFLSFVLPFFTSLNVIMQSEKPQIHVMYKEVTNIVKTIMEFYIKEDILNKGHVYDIDFVNPRNFLELDNMYFGAFIHASSCSANILNIVKKQLLKFYIESIKQILKRFPLKNSIFSKLEFIDSNVVMGRKINSIADVAVHFPNLVGGCNIQDIDNEWRMLRNLNFNDFDITVNDDVQEFWLKISKIKLGNDQPKFFNLINFVFNILCLPHSSANVERCFSQINLNKTASRNRLKSNTLEGILLTKSLVSHSGKCYDFKIIPELIKNMNSRIVYGKDDSDSSSNE